LSDLSQYSVDVRSEGIELTHDLSAEGHDVVTHLVGWCTLMVCVEKIVSLWKEERERKRTSSCRSQ